MGSSVLHWEEKRRSSRPKKKILLPLDAAELWMILDLDSENEKTRGELDRELRSRIAKDRRQYDGLQCSGSSRSAHGQHCGPRDYIMRKNNSSKDIDEAASAGW